MITGLGTDIVEVSRIRDAYIRHGERIARRILSSEEYVQFSGFPLERKVEFLAGRFAAKEAIAKAAGCGLAKLQMPSVHIATTANGLTATFSGQAQPYHTANWAVSISHSTHQAIAVAIRES